MKKREIDIGFPLAGLDRSVSYRQQKPYTTQYAMNVRSLDAIEGRGRGGSRPCVNTLTALGGSVKMLAPLSVVESGELKRYMCALNGSSVSRSLTGRSFTGVGSATFNSDTTQVMGVEHLQRLLIADYGTDAEIKVYDPAATDKVCAMPDRVEADVIGDPPTGCPCIMRFLDRVVVAGPDHLWYMSRAGNSLDWDYAADESDPNRPVSGVASSAGTIGEPIRALMSLSDDYLVFGAAGSLWLMRGDPAWGGMINPISTGVGIVDKAAWCGGPSGEIYFLAPAGLYVLSGPSAPQAISAHKLPSELKGINNEDYTVCLAYDSKRNGLNVFVTNNTTAADSVHFWYDFQYQAFWQEKYGSLAEPYSAMRFTYEGSEDVYMGCKSGNICILDDALENDDGINSPTEVWLGPILLGGDEYIDGVLEELIGVLDAESENLTWAVHVGATAQEAYESTAFASGTWEAGLNYTERPRAGGHVMYLKLSSTKRWSVERITGILRTSGRLRRL